MRLARPLAVLLSCACPLAAGCDKIDLDKYVKRTVIEAMLLYSPDFAEQYGLEGESGDTTILEVYVLQALSGGDSAVSGAGVRVILPGGSDVALQEIEPGHYQATSQDSPGLTYQAGASYEIQAVIDGETFEVTGTAAEETEISGPEEGDVVPAGQHLDVTLTEPADSVVMMVYDDSGHEVLNTLPSSSDALFDLVSGSKTSSVQLEGTALQEDHIYVIAAAGLMRDDESQVSDNVNDSLSLFASGALDAVAVSTMPLQGMAGILMSLSGDDLAQYDIELEEQVHAMLYGARLALDQGLTEQGIQEADAKLTWGSGEVALIESTEEEGLYEAHSVDDPDLVYTANTTYGFTLEDDEGSLSMSVRSAVAPEIADPEAESYHEPGTDLALVTPTSHDLYFVLVADSSGEVIYDDLPELESIAQLGEGSLGMGSNQQIVIPGSNFQDGEMYAVGLLGLTELDEENLDEDLNADLSGMFVGKTGFTMVTTIEMP